MSGDGAGTGAAAQPAADTVLHGSAVAIGGKAVLITGSAGAGKSTLVLEMVALGAELIADDRVRVSPDSDGRLWLSAPENIAGLVEMRGFGLLRLPVGDRAAVVLIADLDQAETERLPPRRQRRLSGIACPLILCKGRSGLASALTCLLRAREWPGPAHFAG